MNDEQHSPDNERYRERLAAVLEQYELGPVVGEGGMGIVYRAFDRRLKRSVAIKLLPPELTFRSDLKSRFLREAETAAGLNHPNIVPIYAVDERNDLVFIIMGFVDGENLGRTIAREGRIDVGEVRRMVRDVADALAYAHERGVVHRDVKPDNILIDAASGRTMVTDFGIARAVSESNDTRLTATGVAIGTPAYMSPEQCSGDRGITGQSDLYSLGVVAYQMLSGKTPFTAPNTPGMLIKHVSEPPAHISHSRSDIPDDLAAIVMRLLEKKPENRFAGGRELIAALDGAIAVRAPRRNAASPRSRPIREERTGEEAMAPEDRGFHWEHSRRRRGIPFAKRPLAERVRITRAETGRVAGMSLFLLVINGVTTPWFPWFIFPTIGMGSGLVAKWHNLRAAGARWRDVYGLNAGNVMAGGPPSGVPSRSEADNQPREWLVNDADAPGELPPRASPRIRPMSPQQHTLARALADYRNIEAQIARLSQVDRERIPDALSTAKALLDRATTLERALQALDSDAYEQKIRGLDEHLADAGREASRSPEQERRISLLRKQRESLQKLVETRRDMEAQFESAAIMLRNLSLDILRLQSAGIQSVMGDVNSATQEARALMREIGHVLDAADEMRGMQTGSRENR